MKKATVTTFEKEGNVVVIDKKAQIVNHMKKYHVGGGNAILANDLCQKFDIGRRELRAIFNKQNKDNGDKAKVSWNQNGVFICATLEELHVEHMKEYSKLRDTLEKMLAYKHVKSNYYQEEMDLDFTEPEEVLKSIKHGQG